MASEIPSTEADSGWAGYLERFHHERAGITEALLGRCTDETGATPHTWATDGFAGGPVVDVGCGSAPTEPHLAPGWVGLDRSRSELAQASDLGRGPLVHADAAALPLRDGGAVGALAVMSLMVVEDPAATAAELARVVRPGGTLRVLLPAQRPLTFGDRFRYGSLLVAVARTHLPFPRPAAAADPERLLEPAGFVVAADEHRRFAFPVEHAADAQLLLDSLYLPGVARWRLALARTLVRRWRGHEVGIPLRLVTAVRVAPEVGDQRT